MAVDSGPGSTARRPVRGSGTECEGLSFRAYLGAAATAFVWAVRYADDEVYAWASLRAEEPASVEKAILELHLTCASGHEVDCAKHLASQLRGKHWEVLAALAAEIVHEHELRTGATVVVVAGAAQAERVLADLSKL